MTFTWIGLAKGELEYYQTWISWCCDCCLPVIRIGLPQEVSKEIAPVHVVNGPSSKE